MSHINDMEPRKSGAHIFQLNQLEGCIP